LQSWRFFISALSLSSIESVPLFLGEFSHLFGIVAPRDLSTPSDGSISVWKILYVHSQYVVLGADYAKYFWSLLLHLKRILNFIAHVAMDFPAGVGVACLRGAGGGAPVLVVVVVVVLFSELSSGRPVN